MSPTRGPPLAAAGRSSAHDRDPRDPRRMPRRAQGRRGRAGGRSISARNPGVHTRWRADHIPGWMGTGPRVQHAARTRDAVRSADRGGAGNLPQRGRGLATQGGHSRVTAARRRRVFLLGFAILAALLVGGRWVALETAERAWAATVARGNIYLTARDLARVTHGSSCSLPSRGVPRTCSTSTARSGRSSCPVGSGTWKSSKPFRNECCSQVLWPAESCTGCCSRWVPATGGERPCWHHGHRPSGSPILSFIETSGITSASCRGP